jgi:hypothetical protein
MSRIAAKDRILACRLTDEEERSVDALAKAAGVSPARYLRNVVIEKVQAAEPRTPNRRTWTAAFAEMADMVPDEAMELFNAMRNGRSLPAGFVAMGRPEQIAWLDREWPL